MVSLTQWAFDLGAKPKPEEKEWLDRQNDWYEDEAEPVIPSDHHPVDPTLIRLASTMEPPAYASRGALIQPRLIAWHTYSRGLTEK